MRRFQFWNEWQAEPAGDGEYHVRRIGGYKIPGMAIGGGDTWFVQIGGKQIPQRYPSAREACKALACHHNRAPIEAETRRHEWLAVAAK